MKIKAASLFFLLFMLSTAWAGSEVLGFHVLISPIPADIAREMKKYTWHPGCPVPLSHLRYIQMPYWGFDNHPHEGALIVHQDLAQEVAAIFKALYAHHFPIQQMRLMDAFRGDDAASMSANNTSAFNCRDLTGLPGVYSQHSYGRAIDINPQINPYVVRHSVSPPNGIRFVNRNQPYPGKITKGSFIYNLFIQHGWDWAGAWYDLQDYQHFEKRANGKRRNPYGHHAKKYRLNGQ